MQAAKKDDGVKLGQDLLSYEELTEGKSSDSELGTDENTKEESWGVRYAADELQELVGWFGCTVFLCNENVTGEYVLV